MKKQTKKTQSKVPFYAQLLTKQEMQRAAAGNAATSPIKDEPHQTMKWPSDGDESTPVNDSVDS